MEARLHSSPINTKCCPIGKSRASPLDFPPVETELCLCLLSIFSQSSLTISHHLSPSFSIHAFYEQL
jgi:hypothetical protein